MKLLVHAQQQDLPPELPGFLDKHVLKPLARLFDASAAELEIHFRDASPPRGGPAQQCRLSFRMPGTRTIHVESLAENTLAALLDCSERLRRLVKREVEKMRSGPRRRMHRPLGRSFRERSTRTGTTPEGDPAAL